jgi:glycosyltransferase involved in cell wall biosynthesis
MIDASQPDYANHPASSARRPYRPSLLSERPPANISLLTPFYNTGTVFLETVRSVLGQSFLDWEWIIVDDGSTHADALDLLENVAKEDGRIRVFRQTNQGPGAARNKAFEHSTARYVCLLDSDDLLEPTFLEKAIWFLESQPAFSFCNSWTVHFGERQFLWTVGFERGAEFLKGNSGPPIAVIRSEAFLAAGGFDESIRHGHEDWDFWLRLATAGHWGHTLPEYLAWYRVSENGRFAQVAADRSASRNFLELIKQKHAGLNKQFPSPEFRPAIPYESPEDVVPFANHFDRTSSSPSILFLIPWMVTGGADRVNLDWIGGLVQRGFHVSVCATLKAQHEWFAEFAALTPDVFILPNFLHLSDIPRFIVYLIRSRNIDTVLISHCTLAYQLLPYLRASCPGVAFVDLSHVEEPHWLNGGHPRFGVGYQDLLDLNIVTTDRLRKWMIKQGAEPSRIELCYSGISPASLAEGEKQGCDDVRASLGLAPEIPLLVFAGRLCAQKNPQLLVLVLHELMLQGVSFHCVVVGDGELRPAVAKLVRKFRMHDSVTMLGALPHAQWLKVVAASNIFLLPSRYEGISVALYEAMAMGSVPVMSAVGGLHELVTSECGILVPQEGEVVAPFVAALRFLIENPERRSAMADVCQRRISELFSLDQSFVRLIEILNQAHVNSRAAPRPSISPAFSRELATLAIEYARLTTAPPPPSPLSRFLRQIRKYKLGRVFLRQRAIVITGQWILNWIRIRRA